MTKLSRDQVNNWRLSKNHLAQRAPKRDMPLVVSDACGLQAQVLSGATLSLWARVENITMEDVEEALWKHWTLVKTWAMRGTLHLLSSNSLSTYIAALRTRYNLHGEKISYRIGPGPEDKRYQIVSASPLCPARPQLGHVRHVLPSQRVLRPTRIQDQNLQTNPGKRRSLAN